MYDAGLLVLSVSGSLVNWVHQWQDTLNMGKVVTELNVVAITDNGIYHIEPMSSSNVFTKVVSAPNITAATVVNDHDDLTM